MIIKIPRKVNIKIARYLRQLHRYTGVSMALFIIYLSLTGVALNHAHEWKLDRVTVHNDWLLDLYGYKSPHYVVQFNLLSEKLVQADDKLWLNNRILSGSWLTVVGAVQADNIVIIASTEKLSMYTLQGKLIDQLDASLGLPTPIEAISVNNQTVWIKTNTDILSSDLQLLQWQSKSPNFLLTWSKPKELTSKQKVHVQRLYRHQLLDWESVIQDLHSGRIFGQWGTYFLDMVGILLIVLAFTGIHMWARQSRVKR